MSFHSKNNPKINSYYNQKFEILHNFKNNTLIKGTIILTLAGILTRIIGFFFRIFLSRSIGAEGIGIYQLTLPLQFVCFSICSSGIETAISKLVASFHISNPKKAIAILKYGIIMSLSISIVISFLMYNYSRIISLYFLSESRCNMLVKWMSISFPLMSIHSCITGYYLGIKKASIPAWSQLIEQLARVGSIYVIISIAENNNISLTPTIAIIGGVIGELASSVFSIFFICNVDNKLSKKTNSVKNISGKNIIYSIMTLALPLTINRFSTSILQTIQHILIPSRLISYGMTSKGSLELFGIITGLVIPLILFPSSLVSSIATLLLPTVAEADSLNNQKKINTSANLSFEFSLVFGIFCTGIFAVYGANLGNFLFSNTQSGQYISILGFLCPFLYCTSTFASIINGLGHTMITFIHNSISIIIQIIFTLVLVPVIGIKGYLLGLLVSCIIGTILHFYSVQKYICFNTNALLNMLIPTLLIYVLTKLSKKMFCFITFLPYSISLILQFIVITVLYCTLYLIIRLKTHSYNP